MASNPMQRKARVSFLMGMFITLLITGAVIVILFMMLMKNKQEENAEKQAQVSVYVLNADVKSGQIITPDMYETKQVNQDMVPGDAVTSSELLAAYSLQDKEGNPITISGQTNDPKLTISLGNGNTEEVKQEEETGNYYYGPDNNKTFIELNEMPIVAKVDMQAKTVLTIGTIAKGDNTLLDDSREQEYNMLVLPTDLETGDYVDVRLMLPSGQDFIVVSKKEVTIPEAAGIPMADTVKMTLNEAETLTMSNAIVDAYQVLGAKLYLAKYTDGGLQSAATGTYMPGENTVNLINSDPNIVARARSELVTRMNNGSNQLRADNINSAISRAGSEGQDNLTTKMQESATNAQNSRQTYLDGLAGE